MFKPFVFQKGSKTCQQPAKLGPFHHFSFVGIMKMMTWLMAFANLAIGLLANPVAEAGDLGPAALGYEMKLTYCLEQRSKRFYRTENLEDLCVLKVAFFDEYVSANESSRNKTHAFANECDIAIITFLFVLKKEDKTFFSFVITKPT